MKDELPVVEPRSSRWLAYLQLFRAPNVFTAVADVTMGCLFVRQALQPWEAWLALVCASALLYSAGMVLNDVYDADIDARERPGRPLPSGRISARWARRLGFRLLAGGVLLGICGGYLGGGGIASAGRSGLVAGVLAACVWLYDARLKSTLAGPLVLGACRALNVLVGMSLGGTSQPAAGLVDYETIQLARGGWHRGLRHRRRLVRPRGSDRQPPRSALDRSRADDRQAC